MKNSQNNIILSLSQPSVHMRHLAIDIIYLLF